MGRGRPRAWVSRRPARRPRPRATGCTSWGRGAWVMFILRPLPRAIPLRQLLQLVPRSQEALQEQQELRLQQPGPVPLRRLLQLVPRSQEALQEQQELRLQQPAVPLRRLLQLVPRSQEALQEQQELRLQQPAVPLRRLLQLVPRSQEALQGAAGTSASATGGSSEAASFSWFLGHRRLFSHLKFGFV